MRNYIIKRIAQAILILFCVMFIIYALIRCLPSSFAQTMAIQLSQAPGAKPYEEWLAQLNASYGLDLDIIPGFFTWLSKAIVGNFGDSWKWNVPATQKFWEVVPLSVIMGGISFVLSLLIAVPLGILAATKQYSRTDYVITAAALVGISLPTFFFATLLKLFFSVKLGWLPANGSTTTGLILPIVTLGLYPMAYITRLTRSSMLDVLGQDYIRTARAKGVPGFRIIFGHALKNSLIPVITYAGPMIAYIVTGSLVVEQIFAVPGIGRAFVNSITGRDYTLIMGTTIVLAILVIVMNLVSDILYKIVDPRIELE